MNNLKLLLTLMIAHFATSLTSQSVNELIALALQHNPGLKAMQLEYQAALQKKDQVTDYPDPSLSVGIGVLPIETRLGAQVLRFGVAQPIPWKGLLKGRSEVMKAQAEILSAKDELSAIDIAYAIRTTYTQIVWLERRKDIIRQKLSLLQVLEDLSTASIRSGRGNLSDVLLVQRMKEMLELDLMQLDNRKTAPMIILNRWTGRPLDSVVEVIDDTILPVELEDYLNFAINDHPQLQIIENQINASKARSELTVLESKPKIAVGLDYAIINGRSGLTIANNGRDVLMPMGTVQIPLHTDRFESRRQEEKLQQEMLSARFKDVTELYQAEIIKAKADIDYEQDEIIKFEQLKLITRETIDLMRTEYASEGTRFEELLRLELELIDYDDAILRSRYLQDLAAATILKYQ